MGIFANFLKRSSIGYSTALLAFYRLENESLLDAEEHIAFIDFVMYVYGQTATEIGVLIGYKCAANQSVATKMDIPFVGCRSHRFNLPVCEILKENESIISDISSIMRKMKNLLPDPKIRERTSLKAVMDSATI